MIDHLNLDSETPIKSANSETFHINLLRQMPFKQV